MAERLTPWFPGSTAPVRHGFYEVRITLQATGKPSLPQRCRFDGEWHFWPTGKPFGQVPGDEWRGLAADPRGVGEVPGG